MFHIIHSLEKSFKTNLVFYFQKKQDLELLSGYNIPKNIQKKLEEISNNEENTFVPLYIGEGSFESLFVFFFFPSQKAHRDYFLGENFKKLPKNITILGKNPEYIELLLNHSLLTRYNFLDYKTNNKEKKEDEIYFLVDKKDEKIVKNRYETIQNIILARNLGNTPSNDLYPESFANIIKNTKFTNTKVKIFDYKKIQKKGFGLLEAVGKGSIHKPYMVVLERIIDKKKPTIGLVGKGVTFDTGGIQVKPGESMYEMKGDMCGAAAVFGVMKELDRAEVGVNVVAAICLAENHISGESLKPSDIITSYSGKTVDIIHTDAEGRLVMADGLSYLSDKYKPERLMTIATLTGACLLALGFRYAGIMGNDEELIHKFQRYSETHIEKYNRLPFDDYFIEKTKSEIADLKNINRGVYAGSTMGAAFLSNFLLHGEKYTHIDIAGTAMNSYEAYAYVNKGMTGFGVESVSEIVKSL